MIYLNRIVCKTKKYRQSCLQVIDESQTSTREIKKVYQNNDLHIPSCLHGTNKSQKQHPTDQEDINKNKESSFQKKFNVLLQKLEYKGQLHQALSSGEEISMLRLSTILLAKSSTSGSTFSTASRYS
jgi:hypothetical protein